MNSVPNFKQTNCSIPSEVLKRLRNLIDKKEFTEQNGIKNDEDGFSWFFMGKRVLYWNNFTDIGRKEVQFHELPVPFSCDQSYNFFTLFKRHRASRVQSAWFVSSCGDIRFWENSKIPSQYLESTVPIRPGVAPSFCIVIGSSRILVLLNDLSLHIAKIFENSISINEISAKNFFPKVITSLFAPFARRSSVFIYHEKLKMVDCSQSQFDSTRRFVVFNEKLVKAYEVVVGEDSYIKEEHPVCLKTLCDDTLKHIPSSRAEFLSQAVVLDLFFHKYLYGVVVFSAASSPVYTYVFSKMSISNSLGFSIESAVLIIPPSVEKFHRSTIFAYSESLILVSLNSTIYAIDSFNQSCYALYSPKDSLVPLSIFYHRSSNRCMVLLSDLKIYSTLLDNLEETINHSMANSSYLDSESLLMPQNETSLCNPLLWPNQQLEHLDSAFKKYQKRQKELSYLMVSTPIPLPTLSNIVTRYSDLINDTLEAKKSLNVESYLVNEAKSLGRKLQWTCETQKEFINFLSGSSLWFRLFETGQNDVKIASGLVACLKNLEKAKMCSLVHKFSELDPIFLKALSSINSQCGLCPSEEESHTPHPSNILNVFEKIVQLEISNLSGTNFATIQQNIITVTKFMIQSLDISSQTLNELISISKHFQNSNIELYSNCESDLFTSFILLPSITDSYLRQISLYTDTMGPNFQLLDSSFCCQFAKKFLLILKQFHTKVPNIPFLSLNYNNILKQSLSYFETFSLIDESIEIVTDLVEPEHLARLCVSHDRLDTLHSYKEKWKEIDFDGFVCKWLSSKKKWKLLVKEIDPNNITKVSSQIPELEWVYYTKQAQFDKVKKSLSYLSDVENNLFFKKTFCSLYKMAHVVEPSTKHINSKIPYYMDLMKYQQRLNDNEKPNPWRVYSEETVLDIEAIVMNKLFQSKLTITKSLIMDSLDLLLKSECDEDKFLTILIIIWGSVMANDAYLKKSSPITDLFCRNESFFYQCIQWIAIKYQNSNLLPSLSLIKEVVEMLSSNNITALSQSFFDRAATVLEVAQDSLIELTPIHSS